MLIAAKKRAVRCSKHPTASHQLDTLTPIVNDNEKDTSKAMRNQTRKQQTNSRTEVSFADLLKAKRKQDGLTQQQAAEAWGVSVKTLHNWEQGRNTPRGLARVALEKLILQE